MVIQVVNFNLEGITHDDFMGVANSVAPNFAPLPGLVSKVWLSDEANNTYGGVYSWSSGQQMDSYQKGELYAGALANNPNFKGLIAPVTPEREYGLEGSPEWNYFQQQVADFRAGRSAYRGQRTKEGSSTFNFMSGYSFCRLDTASLFSFESSIK